MNIKDEDHWHIQEHYSRFDVKHFHEIHDLFEENKDFFQIAYNIENEYVVTHAGISARWYVNRCLHMIPKTGRDYYIDLSDKGFNQYSIEEALKKYAELMYDPILYEPFNPYIKGCIYYHNKQWYYFNGDSLNMLTISPSEIVNNINNLWTSGNYKAFNFGDNYMGYDSYGTSVCQSPVWIRMNNLPKVNIFRGTNVKQVFGHTISEDFQYVPNKKEASLIMVDCLEYKQQSFKIDKYD